MLQAEAARDIGLKEKEPSWIFGEGQLSLQLCSHTVDDHHSQGHLVVMILGGCSSHPGYHCFVPGIFGKERKQEEVGRDCSNS